MRKIKQIIVLVVITMSASAQIQMPDPRKIKTPLLVVDSTKTEFVATKQKFDNGEFVYAVKDSNNLRVGEFWPIRQVNLVTRTTDPQVFDGPTIDSIQKMLGGVATAPDGMTGGSFGNYQMQGRCLTHGIPCGDGFEYDYGLVLVSPNGDKISFKHKRDYPNFDSLYNALSQSKSTLFFLPSIFRNGLYLNSEKMVDKVLIHRDTKNNTEQIGVIIFDHLVTYNQARQIVCGLDRPGQSKTTHIYVLDGGGSWGQSCKTVNDTTFVIGTRDPKLVTNYLVFN